MLDRISFLRIVKTGFSNFTRNWLLSAAASLVMTITLIIFAILALLFSVSSQAIKNTRQRVDISVYMKKGLAEDRILDVKRNLEQHPLVFNVTYVSAAEALVVFKSLNQHKPIVIASLNAVDENPLLATLRVQAKNLDDYPSLEENIKTAQFSAFIDHSNYNDNRKVIDNLTKILNIITSLGIGLVVIFCAVAILVIFNTLTLTIYNRRGEVEIMRLVGATNSYIRGPFLAESIMYSLTATVITAIFLIPIHSRILPKISRFVGSEIAIAHLTNYWVLMLSLLVTAVILSIVSTFLAIRKYLQI